MPTPRKGIVAAISAGRQSKPVPTPACDRCRLWDVEKRTLFESCGVVTRDYASSGAACRTTADSSAEQGIDTVAT